MSFLPLFALACLSPSALLSPLAPVGQQNDFGKDGFLRYSVTGPSRLGTGELYVHSKVRVDLTSQGTYYKFAIGSESGSTYDVQLLFKTPLDGSTSLASRMQLDFEVRADKAIQGNLKVDRIKPPFQNLGLNEFFSVGTEWKAYSYQFPFDPDGSLMLREEDDPGIYCPRFVFPSFKGNIEIRKVFLRHLTATLGEIPSVPSPKTEAQAFQWLAGLPKSFDTRDLGKIVGAWSPNYSEVTVENDGKRVKVGRDAAVKMWAAQISYRGAFADANGPGTLLIESVTTTGSKMTMTGFWAGSWRIGEWTDLGSGGISFDNRFTATWTKTATGWQIDSLVQGPFVELTKAAKQKLEAAHAKLLSKYGGSLRRIPE